MTQKHERPGAAETAHGAKVVLSRQATTKPYPFTSFRATGALILRNVLGNHGEHQGWEVVR